MIKTSVRVTVAAVSGLAITAGAAVSAAAVISPSSASRVVHACVAKADRHVTNYYGRKIIVIPHGTTRIVQSATGCQSWETPISWSAKGAAGKRGASGPNGTMGTAGSNGTDGRNGTDGAPGKGVTMVALEVGSIACPTGGVTLTTPVETVAVCDGDPGVAGLAGRAGLAGVNGVDGAAGKNGADGLDGTGVSIASLLAGDAVCAARGLAVTDSTSTSYVCNGMPGATGQAGAAGQNGATGEAGQIGIQGTTGASGTNGVAGTPGTNGAAGTAGTAGTNGATGLAGHDGTPGSKGDKGDKGDPGADASNSTLVGTDTGQAEAGNGDSCVMGTVTLTAARVGEGTPASGQLMSIEQNIALFSLLGTTYGGDGQTTFRLPSLQALAPNGMTYMICDYGIYPSRR